MAPRSFSRMGKEEGAMSGHLLTVRVQHRPAMLRKPVRVQRVTQPANMTQIGSREAVLIAELWASNNLQHRVQPDPVPMARDKGPAVLDITTASPLDSALPRNGENVTGETTVCSSILDK